MENSDNFRLEAAITQWRAGLENSAAMRASDINELEAHLRDAIHAQQLQGAGEEAAFHSAIRRMGSGHELSREFAKTHWPQVWMDHVLWMAAGLVLVWIIQTSATLIGLAVQALAISWINTIGLSAVAFVSQFSRLLVEGGLWFLLWRLVVRQGAMVDRWARFCIQHPFWPLFGLLMLSLNLMIGARWVVETPPFASADGKFIAPGDVFTRLHTWFFVNSIVVNYLYLVAFACFAYYSLSASGGGKFFGAGKCAGQKEDTFSGDRASIWRERAVWILAGPIIIWTVLLPLATVGKIAAEMLTFGLTPHPMAQGALRLGMQWSGFLAVLAGLYWMGARGACGCGWMKQHLAQKPTASAVMIAIFLAIIPVLVTMGFYGFSKWVLHCDMHVMHEAFGRANSDPQTNGVFNKAMEISSLIWFRVLPVFLVFWIARKQAGLPWKGLLPFKRVSS